MAKRPYHNRGGNNPPGPRGPGNNQPGHRLTASVVRLHGGYFQVCVFTQLNNHPTSLRFSHQLEDGAGLQQACTSDGTPQPGSMRTPLPVGKWLSDPILIIDQPREFTAQLVDDPTVTAVVPLPSKQPPVLKITVHDLGDNIRVDFRATQNGRPLKNIDFQWQIIGTQLTDITTDSNGLCSLATMPKPTKPEQVRFYSAFLSAEAIADLPVKAAPAPTYGLKASPEAGVRSRMELSRRRVTVQENGQPVQKWRVSIGVFVDHDDRDNQPCSAAVTIREEGSPDVSKDITPAGSDSYHDFSITNSGRTIEVIVSEIRYLKSDNSTAKVQVSHLRDHIKLLGVYTPQHFTSNPVAPFVLELVKAAFGPQGPVTPPTSFPTIDDAKKALVRFAWSMIMLLPALIALRLSDLGFISSYTWKLLACLPAAVWLWVGWSALRVTAQTTPTPQPQSTLVRMVSTAAMVLSTLAIGYFSWWREAISHRDVPYAALILNSGVLLFVTSQVLWCIWSPARWLDVRYAILDSARRTRLGLSIFSRDNLVHQFWQLIVAALMMQGVLYGSSTIGFDSELAAKKANVEVQTAAPHAADTHIFSRSANGGIRVNVAGLRRSLDSTVQPAESESNVKQVDEAARTSELQKFNLEPRYQHTGVYWPLVWLMVVVTVVALIFNNRDELRLFFDGFLEIWNWRLSQWQRNREVKREDAAVASTESVAKALGVSFGGFWGHAAVALILDAVFDMAKHFFRPRAH